jgi:uncharacterized protein (UPF0333 family)
MMKTLTAVAVVLAASIAVAHAKDVNFTDPNANESFIAQIGNNNDAVALQAGGNNAQATIQIANHQPNNQHNTAITLQDNDGKASNAALTVQLGPNNFALTGQTGREGENTSLIFQGSDAFSTQTGNTAFVFQRSGDANHGGDLHNTSGVVQLGHGNVAFVAQK